MDRARILIVDDEPAMLENCERMLTREGYDCTTLAEPLRFRQVAAELDPDLVLTDLRMPGTDGMTILAASMADAPARPVIIVTAFASVASAVGAIREGAFDYVTKPFSTDQLLVAVERALRFRRVTVENRKLREQVSRSGAGDGILGASPAMARLLEQVRRVAPTDANVLITGESGTGKELIVRALHAHSLRCDKPFVAVDCAALPEGLLESELFGHERGAFTGAVQRRDGLLVEANGGTLFLDELAELTVSLQVKLLRTLEQRQVRRLGDSRLTELDIRVVAATNADLEAAVSKGTFREDLYYRVNVVHFTVPPLRAREGDLVLLMSTFLEEFAASNHKTVPRVVPEAWVVLERHSWPGNVRELRNLAQRLVVLDDDGLITRSDLPESLRHGLPRAVGSHASGAWPTSYEEAKDAALAEFQASYVRQLLHLHDGNMSRAARAAGVSRRSLHRWVAALQLETQAEVVA